MGYKQHIGSNIFTHDYLSGNPLQQTLSLRVA